MTFLELSDDFSGTTLHSRWEIINKDTWDGAPPPPANHWEVSGGSVHLYANATDAEDRAVMGLRLGPELDYEWQVSTPYWVPGCETIMKIGLPAASGTTTVQWGILNAISAPMVQATNTGGTWVLRKVFDGFIGPTFSWDPAKPWFRFTLLDDGYVISRSEDGVIWSETLFTVSASYNDPRDLTGTPGISITTYSLTDLEITVDEMTVRYSDQMVPFWGSGPSIGIQTTIGESRVGALPTPPLNDNYVDAIPVVITGAAGTYTSDPIDNEGATIETGEPNVAPGSYGRTMWWSYTPIIGGTVTAHTALSTFVDGGALNPDTILGVYTGSSVDALTQIAFNDDTEEPIAEHLTSRVSFNAVAGTTYYLQAGLFADDDDPSLIVLSVIGPGTQGTAYDGEVLVDGPVLYWKLDDEDTAANDTSGHGHDGTNGGVGTRVVGLHDGSDYARETTNIIEYPAGGETLISGIAFSYEFWLSTATTGFLAASLYNDLMVVQFLGNHPAPGSFAMTWTEQTEGGAADAVLVDSTTFNDGLPHHFVVRCSGPNLDVFVDAQQVGTVAYTNTAYALNRFHVMPFSGTATFDSVAVYDAALTTERIVAHYVAGGGEPPPEFGQRAVEVDNRVDVEPGQIWTMLVSAKSAATQAGVQPFLKLYNEDDVEIGNTLDPDGYTAINNTDYTSALISYTVPEDGTVTSIRAAVGFQGLGVAVGTTFEFGKLALERATPESARYFTGFTSSTTADYLWEGAPHYSRSVYFPQRTFKVARLRQLVQNFIPHGTSFAFRFGDYPGEYPHDWAVANYNFEPTSPAPTGVYVDLGLQWGRALTYADITSMYNDWTELAALNDTYDDLNEGRQYTWDNFRDTYTDYDAITASGLSWATLAQGY